MAISSFSVSLLNASATADESPSSIVSETVAESPLAENDYTNTVLSEYTDVFNLTNDTVTPEDRIRIEKAMSIIDEAEKNDENVSFENESVYLKSLLLRIGSLEQVIANDFYSAYSQYLDTQKVSDSDCTITLSTLSEMLEVYYSYSESVQNKIRVLGSERLDRCIELFNEYSSEKNEYLTKHEGILNKDINTITLDDRDSILNAVTDFSLLSKAAQSMLVNEKKTIDGAMTKYLELKEKYDKANSEPVVSASDIAETEANSDKVVSSSDLSGTVGDNNNDSSDGDPVKSAGTTETTEDASTEKNEDIGYDVYDTGDSSFGLMALATDTLWLSMLAIMLMYFFINEYIGMDKCIATGKDFYATMGNVYKRANAKWTNIRSKDFDILLEDCAEGISGKIESFKKKHERINYIQVM